MTLRITLAALLLAACSTTAAPAANVTLTRVSRPVSDAEATAGAPLGGFVHEFFATSSTDVISVMDVAVDAPLFSSTLGVQNAAPTSALAALSSAVGAHSFIATPGETIVLGGGFDGLRGLATWGDLTDDGPQDSFLFARLTVGQTGTFSGTFAVKGYDSFVPLPFQFTLPGTAADMALLAGEPTYSLDYSLDPPPIVLPPTPDPPVTLPPNPVPPIDSPPTTPPTIPDPPAQPWDPPADPPIVSDPPLNDPVETPPSTDPPQFGEIITWIPPREDWTAFIGHEGVHLIDPAHLTIWRQWAVNSTPIDVDGTVPPATEGGNFEYFGATSTSFANFLAYDGGPIVALNGMTSAVQRSTVPEPAAAALLSGCLLLLAAQRRRVAN